MGFFSELWEIAKELFLNYQLSQIYPLLREMVYKYMDEGYVVSKYDLFSASLYKDGFFGRKTVSLQVLEDGSIMVIEKGKTYVIPPRFGVPKPQEFLEELNRRRQASEKQANTQNKNTSDEEVTITLKEAYKILGISEDATKEQIKKAYHKRPPNIIPTGYHHCQRSFRSLPTKNSSASGKPMR